MPGIASFRSYKDSQKLKLLDQNRMTSSSGLCKRCYPEQSCSNQRIRCGEMCLASLPIVTVPLFPLCIDVFANCDTCPVTYGALAV